MTAKVKLLVPGFAFLLALFAWITPAPCDEGMWLPQEVPAWVVDDMHAKGCRLAAQDIWNTSGTGLASAIVHLGATGSFVSPDGLILTNHHVAFGSVQRMSTPEKNYIDSGFLAKTRQEEVPALGYTAYVLETAEDVTGRILSAAKPSMSPLQRYKAIDRKIKQTVSAAETRARRSGSDIHCEVANFAGARYILYSFLKLRDVRVVYVPARSIGEYGGEIDNWVWPRHTADFSFLRAYVAPDGRTAEFSKQNVPFQPKRYLKVDPAGLEDGDFALIIGFPRATHRYLTSYALADYADFQFPQEIRLSKQIVSILEGASERDPAAAVRVAGRMKNLNNYIKKDTGVLEGFGKFNLVEREKEAERETASRLAGDPASREKYAKLLDDFKSLYEERARYAMKDLVLRRATEEGLLGQAMVIYKWSIEKTKHDLDRDPRFMGREIPDLRKDVSLFQRGFDPQSDRAILRMFFEEMAALPEGQHVRACDSILPFDGALDRYLDHLYANTRIDKEEERLKMFDLSHGALLAQNDAFIELAAKLYAENEEKAERSKAFDGVLDLLMPRWMEFVAARSGHEAYPDANSTMRINYGMVSGYAPRDAVWYKPFTTLRGVIEKNTGVFPFNCPARLIDAAARQTHSPYSAKPLGDLPVDFLTTNDSTNGNSGSPVLNARGELVGCLFDGNYEAVSGDFAFDGKIQRSISVDIRYVLWIAAYVDDAQNILQELGVNQ